ncbi:MAG: VWA domain-containing protein [Pseudomonadota bacterium]
MMKTDDGFIVKVVAGSDKIKAYSDASGSEETFQLDLLQPYFVICEDGDYFHITDLPADTVDEALAGNTGFVLSEQTHQWPTREALSFSEIAFIGERPEIVAWDDEEALDGFMETGNQKLHPPAFKEDLEATRLRERSTRPYPVLGSDVRKLRKVAEKRVYNVLLPAAITPAARIEIEEDDVAAAQVSLQSATILVVFDATASMGEFAKRAASAIGSALTTLDKDVVEQSTMGFLFFRDEDDDEKLVEVPPIPLREAAAALLKASDFMTGGGDEQEPILDAMYYASNIYDWGQSGRRIIIGVLNDDAKPATTGGLDDEDRVPVGQDAFTIARDLYEKSIPVITVQAGPNKGPNLVPVLQTLADETATKALFWGPDGVSEAELAEAVVLQLGREAKVAIDKGENALDQLKYDLNGYATIPLEVLDGEMLERLRAAGVDFNIEPGEGGVLVREGYVLENTDLLAPEIQIEKETLVNLVNLYSVLSAVGVDGEGMIQSISEAVAAIAGEDYDPSEPIEETISKRLGIQFRSDLLNFDLAFIDAMLPAERLAMTKRIQDASTALSQYLEANQAEFDEQVAVWMPVSILP